MFTGTESSTRINCHNYLWDQDISTSCRVIFAYFHLHVGFKYIEVANVLYMYSLYSAGSHFCQVDYRNTKLLSSLIMFLILQIVGFTLRKMKAQLKKKMIKSGFLFFLTSLFFLLKALLCCNKAVLYQMDINVYHIIGTISG